MYIEKQNKYVIEFMSENYLDSKVRLKNVTLSKRSSRVLRCHTMQRDGTAAHIVTLNADSSTDAPALPLPPTFKPELSNSGESRNSPGNM